MRLGMVTVVLATLISINCGPRLAPRIEVADDTQRQAYTAFWWNCVIVKSIDLAAACPATCSTTPAATDSCSAGARDAQNDIAALEKKYGPERTREILSLRIGEEEGHAQIQPYFPYGPTPEKPRD